MVQFKSWPDAKRMGEHIKNWEAKMGDWGAKMNDWELMEMHVWTLKASACSKIVKPILGFPTFESMCWWKLGIRMEDPDMVLVFASCI